ncbi:MAG: hypothetical protein ACRCTZ_22575 [Sarcina sp.]
MILHTAQEVLKDIYRSFDICDLYYFDLYKTGCIVRYGRKDYACEVQMRRSEFNKLIEVLKLLDEYTYCEVY